MKIKKHGLPADAQNEAALSTAPDQGAKESTGSGNLSGGASKNKSGSASSKNAPLTLGEKIHALRSERKMTQTELAGDFITRNMLSKIENGSSIPSFQTLEYLADRLGISPGYFFDSDVFDTQSQLAIFKKLGAYGSIRDAYMRKDYGAALSLCLSVFFDSDDELNLIMSDCHFRLGVAHFNSGKLISANESFRMALLCAEKTLYPTGYISSAVMSYLNIIGTVGLETVFHPESSAKASAAENDLQLSIYSHTLLLLSRGSFKEGAAILNSNIITNRSYSAHLSAKLALANSDYSIAKQILLSLLEKENAGSVMLYHIYSDLEICCRSTGDYKEAYEYSAKKLELFKNMHK